MDSLMQFLDQNPHIPYAKIQDPRYASLRTSFIEDDSVIPQIIIRPQSAADVSLLIPILRNESTPFAIRSGGHDLFSRSQAHDGVTIDMRDIAHVHVTKDRTSAHVGGGIVFQDLATRLDDVGLTTACPVAGEIGYVGWATHGGYGTLSALYGLGVDQILGAKLVTANGLVIDADDELLKGIRGAGGLFGVVVELTIRVYPIYGYLGGVIHFPSPSVSDTIHIFHRSYSALCNETTVPPNLGMFQAIGNPELPTYSILFLWASPSAHDMAEGDLWLKKIISLAPSAVHTVNKIVLSEFLGISRNFLSGPFYGRVYTINIRSLTPEALDILARGGESLPRGTHASISLHQLRGSHAEPNSTVFSARYPHYVVEIVSVAESESAANKAEQWGKDVLNDFRSDQSDNVLPGSYINLTPSDEVDIDAVYGDCGVSLLRRLKTKYDPANVFQNAIVRF
ncbi:hypothetical protein BDV59DRAFT_211236 [Aspergillus ambiguus]|uniref:FAD-binding oxidoreductase n=1 Tax=Aspergillus ambiguus TaxID=176160 RepID=UPI003CCCF07D